MRESRAKWVLRDAGIAVGSMMPEFAAPGILRIAAAAAPSSPCWTWSTPGGAWRRSSP